MATALRCESKKHAEQISDHIIEVKCSSRFCGARRGVVVLHRFNLATGDMTTRTFQEPPRKENSNAPAHRTAVRHP